VLQWRVAFSYRCQQHIVELALIEHRGRLEPDESSLIAATLQQPEWIGQRGAIREVKITP
jgi:hypothetical protein